MIKFNKKGFVFAILLILILIAIAIMVIFLSWDDVSDYLKRKKFCESQDGSTFEPSNICWKVEGDEIVQSRIIEINDTLRFYRYKGEG